MTIMSKRMPWWLVAFVCIGISIPSSLAQVTNEYRYLIAPQDILVVDVFGEKDFSREFKVEANGDITYPFLGAVKVGGMATSEAESKLKDMLAQDYLVDPQVTVTVKEYRKRIVTVMGEVTKPGAFDLPGEQKWTIIDAIGQAGGPTKAANRKRIQFTRRGKTQEFKLEDLQLITEPEKVIWLEPGDSVNVPQTVW
jgi:polysaccharide export outer membrane protein